MSDAQSALTPAGVMEAVPPTEVGGGGLGGAVNSKPLLLLALPLRASYDTSRHSGNHAGVQMCVCDSGFSWHLFPFMVVVGVQLLCCTRTCGLK